MIDNKIHKVSVKNHLFKEIGEFI